MKAGASGPGLTFDWPRHEGFPFALFGCVAVSLVAHAATFFLFQVAEPPGTTIAHPAPQVSLLTPSSPEAIALLHWIDAQDPALVAAASVVPPGMPEAAYRPSYATLRTAPLGPVETPVAVPFPPVRDPLALIAGAAAKPAAPTARTAPQPTAVGFPDSLASRIPSPLPAFEPKARAVSPVEPTRHLIGINDRGEVRFVFLQDSSGQAALDNEAAAHLQKLVFAPGETPITWTIATVTWGDETYAPSPIPELPSPK